jgi:MFS family permease
MSAGMLAGHVGCGPYAGAVTGDLVADQSAFIDPDASGAGSRRGLQIGLVAVVTLVAFESLAVTTILPDIEADLGGVAWYGWVTSAFFLGTMIGIVFAGDQADRRGAGRPYVIGLVLFATGLAIGGLAPSMPVLVVGRFIQGFGAGVVPAIGYIAIGRAFSVRERPRMFAILSTAWVVPGLVGPVLAERIAQGVGWRWVFLGLMPLVAVAGVLVIPAMMRLGPVAEVESTAVPFWRRRLVEAVRVAVGAALIVAGLTFDRWLLVPAVLAGTAIGLGSLRRLTPPGTLRGAPGLPAVIASRGMITFAFFALDAFVPYALTSGRDRSTLAASIAVTTTTVSWTSGAWIQQRWIGRLGEAWFIRTGFALLAPGIALAALASLPDGLPFWLVYIGGIVAGLGMGFAYSAHAQLTFRSVEEREVGSATASLQLSDNLGIALGTGAVGAIVALGDDSGWAPGATVAIAWVVPALVAASGVLLARRLPRTATP